MNQETGADNNLLGEETRKIYHEQHNRLNADEIARARIHSMYTERYFELPDGYFSKNGGRVCLDAGCGNMAVLMIRLLAFGVKEVHGIDLGEDWIPHATRELQQSGNYEGKYFFKSGDVLNIPYDDEHFDFVACNGVLVHLANLSDVEKAFSECMRVLKKGGWLYTSYGTVGGILEGVIFPALREHYKNNEEFKTFIDNIKTLDFENLLNKIDTELKSRGGEDVDCLSALKYFDEDFCVYLQNVLQPPSRLHQQCSSEYVNSLYERTGLGNIRRLKRYVTRNNVRKFFAPLHYDRDHKWSKILYGEGSVEYIGQKK
ncbi:MAG: class I SAM-dependent methyltransferase [Holosporaceae bacterium]|jgi:ubiquinone/menaquinone biosynthesis C-methylase UbiE|nr:class I SAM-dependent methyltransferase [Holosporaceae bacterium]